MVGSSTAVKNLYLSKRIAPRIAAALQEITGGGTTGVLSTLQNLYVEGSSHRNLSRRQLRTARQITNHPVAVSVWDRAMEEQSEVMVDNERV